MKEQYPLIWPENWPRTRINDRVSRGAWKGTTLQYKKRLEQEMARMKVRSIVLTSNVQQDYKGEPRDPSVAIYFTRPPAEDDFSWQETLGINNPDPKLDEIELRFKTLMKQYHTDNPDRGNLEMSVRLNEARKRATQFVTGEYGKENQLSIACDKYKEVRLNIAAIATAISYLRRLEDVSVSGIMDRAFSGFRAELTEGSRVHSTTA